MLYNKYGSVSPKKRFILLCLPLAAAIICTACNNAYAVNISDGGISYDNTYSQTESTSADTDKTTSQIKEEEPLPLGITDEVQIFRAAHLDPFYGVAVLLSSEVPRFQDTFLHF